MPCVEDEHVHPLPILRSLLHGIKFQYPALASIHYIHQKHVAIKQHVYAIFLQFPICLVGLFLITQVSIFARALQIVLHTECLGHGHALV